jgi:hypothetical protein
MKALFLLLVVACSQSTRNTTLSNTLASLNTAQQAFLLYDATHEQDISQNAHDKPSGELALSQWRQQRSVIDNVFVSAYKALAVAATANDNPSLQAMENALALVLQQLTTLGVKVP